MRRIRKAIVLCCIFGTAGLLLNLAVASTLMTLWSTNWFTTPSTRQFTQHNFLWQELSGRIWEVTEFRTIGWRHHRVCRSDVTDYLYDARSAHLRRQSAYPIPPRPADWVQPAWSRYTVEPIGVMFGRGQDIEVLPLETAAGWPLLAFADQARTDQRFGTNAFSFYLPRLTQPVIVPWYPIWSGAIINTLLYGLLLYLLYRLPFVLRRARRIRRGLCLRCAYNLAGLERCPECGSLKA